MHEYSGGGLVSHCGLSDAQTIAFPKLTGLNFTLSDICRLYVHVPCLSRRRTQVDSHRNVYFCPLSALHGLCRFKKWDARGQYFSLWLSHFVDTVVIGGAFCSFPLAQRSAIDCVMVLWNFSSCGYVYTPLF